MTGDVIDLDKRRHQPIVHGSVTWPVGEFTLLDLETDTFRDLTVAARVDESGGHVTLGSNLDFEDATTLARLLTAALDVLKREVVWRDPKEPGGA